jgi:hypothetical protein
VWLSNLGIWALDLNVFAWHALLAASNVSSLCEAALQFMCRSRETASNRLLAQHMHFVLAACCGDESHELHLRCQTRQPRLQSGDPSNAPICSEDAGECNINFAGMLPDKRNPVGKCATGGQVGVDALLDSCSSTSPGPCLAGNSVLSLHKMTSKLRAVLTSDSHVLSLNGHLPHCAQAHVQAVDVS